MSLRKKIVYIAIFSSVFIIVFITTLVLLTHQYWFWPYKTQIEYTYDSKLEERLDTLKSECDKQLSNGSSYEDYMANYNEILTIYKEIKTYYKIEYLNVCYDDDKANKRYLNIYGEIIDNTLIWLGKNYSKLKDSGFKDRFFSGKSESEINYIIKSNSEEAINASNEISNIQADYDDLNDEEKDSKYYYYLTKYVNANQTYAKATGYDNYFNYANEREYERDYSKDDITNFLNYINTYFIESFNNTNGFYRRIYNYYSRYGNFSKMDKLLNYNASEFNKSSYKDYDNLINQYVEYISEDFKNSYISFKNRENGYLIETDEEDCYEGAFTAYLEYFNKPVMFLGTDTYQTPFVYIHEYGHYYNFLQTGSNNTSLDLCETHSQADELLFLNFIYHGYYNSLDDGSDSFSIRGSKYITAIKLEEFCKSIILSSLIGSIETELYTTSNITEDNIEGIINNAMTKYFPNIFNMIDKEVAMEYVNKVLISRSMYYISYATSLISSLSIYEISFQNYQTAIDKYLYIQDYNNYEGYIETLNKAGINNPFNNETYVNLYNIFNYLE